MKEKKDKEKKKRPACTHIAGAPIGKRSRIAPLNWWAGEQDHIPSEYGPGADMPEVIQSFIRNYGQ
jgi:hypothetical protein